MKLALKSVVFLVLLFAAVHYFRQFRSEYDAASAMAAALPTERGETNAATASAEGASTNAESATATESVATNQVETATTSAPGDKTNQVAVSAGTATNAAAVISTNSASQSAKPPTYAEEMSRHRSSSMVNLGLFIGAVILLGGFGAWEVARAFGEKSHSLVFQENEGGERDPEYEAAEQEWSNGNYLEAIRQMREYLKQHPSEQYVALRIAEIYEKDLGNHVAAAMELEEVLTKKLPREKWGWTAIHLANVYSGKLNKPEQALALLTRVVEHYPETGAAKKARARLGIPEPELAAQNTDPAAADPATDDGSDASETEIGRAHV